MDSLFIVMPAYNEEENIEAVINQWYGILDGKSEKSRIVVADSGSKDNTHTILEELKRTRFPQLEILPTDNQYHGPKLIALYKYAIDSGIDYVFQTDSDGQTNPEEFEAFWQQRKEYDGIFGNRVVRGDGKQRAIVEKVVCVLLKLFFKVQVPDANAPFRLMKTSVVAKYIDRFSPDYFLPNIMLTTYFVYYGEKSKFAEISFIPRQGGKNSINIGKIFKIGMKSLKDFYDFKKDMH